MSKSILLGILLFVLATLPAWTGGVDFNNINRSLVVWFVCALVVSVSFTFTLELHRKNWNEINL